MQLPVDNIAIIMCEQDNRLEPRRDRRIPMFDRHIDCRYFDAFKRLKNKFKEMYGCSQDQCPAIRERMIQHMKAHHGYKNNAGTTAPMENPDLNHQNLKTEPKIHNLSPMATDNDTGDSSDKTATHSDVKLLDTNVEDTLKIKLKDELVNIFEYLPHNPKNKEAMLTALADDISKIIVSNHLDTDDKIKAEIDKAVNKLLMNYPGTKLDKYKLVGDVRAKLFDIVKDRQQDVDKECDSDYNVSNMHDDNGFPKDVSDLTDPIKKLFKNYPLHEKTKLSNEDKDNLLNNFIDDINQIARNTSMTDADKKAEIEKILDNLHSKYPEATDSQEIEKYKKVIRDELLDLIENKPKDLTGAIKKLFKNYPIHTKTKLSKVAKDKLLNNFIDDIKQIARNTSMTDADKKAEVEKIIDNLHSKYPELRDSQENEKYKKVIRDELFDLIEDKPKDLTDAIKKLFKSYPVHTETKLSKEAKDKLLNNFIDDIKQIARNTSMTEADKKAEIERILNNLHSKYPELRDSQEIEKYKKVIRNELFDLIEDKPKDLTGAIKTLFKNYPIHTETKLSKEAKDKLLHNLTDEIIRIASSKTIPNTNKKIEIEDLLDDFHLKYPGPKNDQDTQKQINKIRENLFDLIIVKPKKSKKQLEASTNDASAFSGPSGTGGIPKAGRSSGKKGKTEKRGFVTGAQSYGGQSRRSNNKIIGVSARSYGGMNNKMAGNRTTNKLYGGGKDSNDSEVGSNGFRGVNSDANNTSTIGNGIGPNDGVFGGYSGGFDNGPRNIHRRNDNPTNNNLSQEVTQFFKRHPIFNQSPQFKDSKENTIRNLVEDVNKLAANNNLNDDDVVNEVEKLVETVHVKYPGHKSVQAKYRNEIKDKLCDIIYNARNYNIGNHRNSKKDNNEAGTSKNRPEINEYDLRKSLNNALKDIAIYPKNKYEHRDSLVNNIIDDISLIAASIQPDNDDELNCEVERALNTLHLWYPGAKRDQIEYRNDIKNRIINIIKEYHKNKPLSTQKNDYHKNKHVSSSNDDTEESITSVSSYGSNSYKTSEDIRSIKHWVNQLKHEKFMDGVDTDELTENIINRIIPILKSNNCCGIKIILKGALLEILNEIPASAKCNNKLQRLVNDFVNNLYCRYKNTCCTSDLSKRIYIETLKKCGKPNKLNEFFDYNCIAQDHDVRKEIVDVIMAVDEDEETLNLSVEYDQENYIKKILENKTIKASPSEVINIYKNIIKFLNNDDENDDGTYLIYTLDTPETKITTEVQKLNDEERKYIHNLSNLIRAWMETLPVQFNSKEEKSFKDAVVAELAGEIMDFAKITQITPHTKDVMDNYNKHLVYKWLYKLNVFDKNKMAPYVDDFLRRLEDIPVPVLTRPHQGTRQVMDNIKLREEQGWEKDFLPKGIDVLEDEISIWVNEQPSDMFNFNKETRNNKIHNLAEAIQSKLKNKHSESRINRDIEQWLKNNIRMDKCGNIDEVKNSLKDRIIKLPGDATILANYDEKQRERAAKAELMKKQENEPKKNRIDEDTMDIERTMKDFIVKFVDHHYDVDDPLAIRAFNYLLKSKLQRMNLPVNYERSCSNEALSPQKLYEELELVKTVSDWLKSVPVDKDFHTIGNKERIDLVLDLTRTIRVLEDEREAAPDAMDHEVYLASSIHAFFCNIPISDEYVTGPNYGTMLTQLLHRVSVWRELIAKKRIEKFHDTSGINDENLGDFIEEFIRHHGTEIANDEVKMEAWSIRLLREIKKMVQNSPDSKILTKTQVYNKLATVPIPGDDTVEQFDRELVYIAEITCWMKNIPLLLYEKDEKKREEEEENKRIMICDLAETMAKKKNLANDAQFKEYLKKWIQDLPLDKEREINIPFLIDQLIRRIERATNNNDVLGTTKSKKDVTKTSSRSNVHVKYPKGINPGTIATDAIEKWSNSLPIKLDEAAKGGIQRKLYQKVSEFNSDPIVFHDDLLYQTLLTIEVEEVLVKLPEGDKLQKSLEKQNKELVKSLVDARKMAKEKGAGDDYKHRLERTIDASIPSPVTSKQVFDPAFEIYKSRLADIFILDNFDYSNDEVKMKYEKLIKDEIDKYFNSAERRNASRLTKHEIYNKLYSALFKVSIPNEKSVMDEVEQIKTRCEIDTWVAKLPLIHNNNLLDQLELDKKVETLAKRIHEIEKLPKSDEKLQKKISKWLTDVPLQQGEEVNIEEYADLLLKELKISKSQRKCVKGKQGKGKARSKQKQTKHDESQIPGPSTLDVSVQPSTKSQPNKSADLIIDIVEQWSHNIPLSSYGNIDAETIRNDVVRKVLIKISDIFNTNPEMFNNDYLFKDILDEQLDKILNEIPKRYDFKPDERAQIKSTLIEALTALKPLIRKEKNRLNYKHDLNCTVDRTLQIPKDLPDNKQLEFQALKEDIIENFVQMHYDKDDYEGRQEYKEKVHDAVTEYLTKIAKEKDHNPQIRTNQLLIELAKVPVPDNDVLEDEVKEIRMKNDITEFFDVNHVKKPKHKSIDVIKTNLAKKLCDIEKTGHNTENDDKMKKEITRTLKKLDKELKPQTIEVFVNKLKADESLRKKKVTSDDNVSNKNSIMPNSTIILDTSPNELEMKHTSSNKPKSGNDAKDYYKDDTYKSSHKEKTCNDDTCPHFQKVKSCNDATCPDQILEDDTLEDRNKDNYNSPLRKLYNKKLQTDPIDANDEYTDLPAQRLGGEETCPCQRQMREMWRYYMTAAGWWCEGPEDPYCREEQPRREMRTMGPNMMALLRR